MNGDIIHTNALRSLCSKFSWSGLGLEWILPPPNEVEVGVEFNVSYRPTASELFYLMRPGFDFLKYVEGVIWLVQTMHEVLQ